jgi:hypothetical protein
VTLRPLPNVDGIKALRWVLKSALRKHGLKCIDVREAGAAKDINEAPKDVKELSHG